MFFVFPIFSLSMDSYLVCIWSKSIWQKHFWCNTTETRLIFPMASLHVYSAGFTTRLGAWFSSLEIEGRFSLQGCLTFKSNSNQSNLIKWFFSYTHFFKKKIYRYTNINIYIYWYVMYVCMLFFRHNISKSAVHRFVCPKLRVYRGDGENQKKANARHVPRCWTVSGQWQRR